MATFQAIAHPRVLGVVALVFGILGAVFNFWVPLGLVLALTGLLLGIAGWSLTPARSGRLGLLVVATAISLAALVLDLVIAIGGLESIQFTALR